METQTIDATKVKFDLKTIVLLLGAAWTPAAMIGGGLMKWGVAMDHRLTVQEETNTNLAVVLNKLDATLSSDVKELRHDVQTLKLELATMKANSK
jgi:hypothetical protein